MNGRLDSIGSPETVKKGSSLDKATRRRAPMQANGEVAGVVPGSGDRACPRSDGRPSWTPHGLFCDELLEPLTQVVATDGQMGQAIYRHARQLLITADCGGSNGSRVWLWRVQLQRLADKLGLPISVCHFPPGTSK